MRIILRHFDKETNSFTEAKLKKSVSIYTGVIDRNGNKVFTGDIIGITENCKDDSDNDITDKYTGIVVLKESAFCVDFIDATYLCDDLMILSANDNVVVIGNIWQDSDILCAIESKKIK